MPFKSKQRVVTDHAAAVIGNLDKFFPTGFDLQLNARGSRIQRVLQQFLYHRRRTFNYLARSNLVGNSFGEDMNTAHRLSFKFRISTCKCKCAGALYAERLPRSLGRTSTDGLIHSG